MEEENKNSEKTEEENQTEKVSKFSYFFELVKVIIWALIIIIPIRTFLFQPFFVQGASMEPNFHDGEYLIVNEFGYKETNISIGKRDLFKVDSFKDFQRGNVIVFRYPNNPKDYFIKRIIGLPNERVVIEDGKIQIYNQDNSMGVIIDEKDYLPMVNGYTECKTSHCEFNLKEGEFMVLGDNRSHSSDSRSWGILDKKFIIGKVLLRAWPVNSFDFFN